MALSFNLLGPQGSGKGTQADALVTQFDFVHIDLGENLRQFIASDSELGRQIEQYVNTGKRVPADLIGQVTGEIIQAVDPEKDILFDGLLRGLDELEVQRPIFAKYQLPLPVIIFLNLDEESAIERLSNRRICSSCRARYRFNPGEPAAEVCSRCGGRLATRHDDTPEAISQRLEWYHEYTEPVIDYFRQHGTVIEIDASPSIESVTTVLVQKVEDYYKSQNRTSPRKRHV